MVRRVLGFSALLVAIGCGSSDGEHAHGKQGGGGSGGVPYDSAPHTQVPLLVNHHGGVLSEVQLVTITFAGYDWKDQVEAFGDYVLTSEWYTTIGSEYGVNAGKHVAKVVLEDAAPSDEAGLFSILEAHFSDGTIPSPSSGNGQNLYMVYIPQGSDYGAGSPMGHICSQDEGYHYFHEDATGRPFAYAVVGHCGSYNNTMNTASHELIEGATDPYPPTGWDISPAATDPWYFVTDNEIADMCEYFPGVITNGFDLARVWSNKAAAAGQNPCYPIPASNPVYRQVSAAPTTIQRVARGNSATFTLTGWATGPQEPWKIYAYTAYYSYFNTPTHLSNNMISNGATVELTVTVPSNAQVGDIGMVEIDSDYAAAQSWYVAVEAM